jgi:hypothetical protein
MVGTLMGEYTKWSLFDHERAYGTVQNLPYKDATELIMPNRFVGAKGTGSQRELVLPHVKKLRKEMEEGTFTPTVVSAACTKKHVVALDEVAKRFTLKVDSDTPLDQTDGGHRFEALRVILKALEQELAEDPTGPDAEMNKRWLEQVRNMPVTVVVYFDGDPQKDFVRLQAGKAVDATHLLSLRIVQRMEVDPAVKTAFETAKLLHKLEGSPFRDQVRFDSRGRLPLPINTLCARGSSDIATSLVGLARVGLAAGKNAAWLAAVVVDAYAAVEKHAPDLLQYGRVLTPMANEGKKGQSTMLVGLGTMLAYRLVATNKDKALSGDLEALAAAAKATLWEPVVGNFSGPMKRALMGEFANAILADVAVDKWDSNGKEIPVSLIKTLSASAFAVDPLPKEPKPKKERVKKDKAKSPKAKANKDDRKKAAGADAVTPPAPVEDPAECPFDSPAAGEGQASWDEGELVGTAAGAAWDEVQG